MMPNYLSTIWEMFIRIGLMVLKQTLVLFALFQENASCMLCFSFTLCQLNDQVCCDLFDYNLEQHK